MKNKRRKLKLILLLLALALVSVALLGFTLLKGTPDYYILLDLSPEQRDAAAQRAEDTITRMQNLAAAARGAEIRASTNPSARPVREGTTFSFTQDELNSLFAKWSDKFGWRETYGRYLENPIIILQDNRVILAGRVRVRNIDSVVSFRFEPRIDEKHDLDLNLEGVRAGNLPVPQDMLFAPFRDRFRQELESRVPRWQQNVKIDSHGGANDDTMKVALAHLFMNVLQEKPADNVIFLPVFQDNRRVPVSLSDVQVTDKQVTFTVVPMDAQERTKLIEHLKEPIDFSTMGE